MITSEMKIKMKIKINTDKNKNRHRGKVHPEVCPTEISER